MDSHAYDQPPGGWTANEEDEGVFYAVSDRERVGPFATRGQALARAAVENRAAARQQPQVPPLVRPLVKLVRTGMFQALTCELQDGWVYKIGHDAKGEIIEALTRSRSS